jgi:uncharacterized protein (DUF983 family)
MQTPANEDAMPVSVQDAAAPRSVPQALRLGWSQTCPNCSKGELYRAYLKVADSCAHCGEEFHHHRADDAPPYFTMLVTGHVIVGGILFAERLWAPPTWLHLTVALPVLLLMSLWLLPRVKGALVGLQWALRMHGFGGTEDQSEPDPAAGAKHGTA